MSETEASSGEVAAASTAESPSTSETESRSGEVAAAFTAEAPVAAEAVAAAPVTEAPVAAAPVTEAPVAAAPLLLPAGWTAHLDENSGSTYYWNASTGMTSWMVPAEAPLEKRPRTGAAKSDYLGTLLGSMASSSSAAAGGLSQWEKHSDPKTGVPFFFHTATLKTQWEVPAGGFVDATVANQKSDASAFEQQQQQAEYSQVASFNKKTGSFDQVDGKSYWELTNRPHDREGRMMSQYFDLSTLEANRAEAEKKKEKLKKYDWKKYAAAKKKMKMKRKVRSYDQDTKTTPPRDDDEYSNAQVAELMKD